jgi:hypothetical protein
MLKAAERNRSRQPNGSLCTVAVPAGHVKSPLHQDFMPRKVFIKTFGCQMNEYDSDKMADVLSAAEGYEPTDDPESADLILFNTCSVREKS